MKYTEIEQFVKKNNLLQGVEEKSGIYAITLDNKIVYIGQSKNIYFRCCQHIYNTENATFNKEKKYLLLLAAKLGGHNVDCIPIDYADPDCLTELENLYIEQYSPMLNILTPHGKQDITKLKIEDLLEGIK